MESILQAAAEASATSAGYILLRLPHEVKPLFLDWLEREQSRRAEHVFSLLRQMHGGKEYDSRFGHQQRGNGPLAGIMQQRFKVAMRRFGLAQPLAAMDCSLFHPPKMGMPKPARHAVQIPLF